LGEDQVSPAIKKLDFEPFFERVNAVTNSSRRDVQFLRRELEAAATRGGFKQAQAVERWYKPHRRGDRNSRVLFLAFVAARMKVCIAAKMNPHDSKSQQIGARPADVLGRRYQTSRPHCER
jgi:hypothetical protein